MSTTLPQQRTPHEKVHYYDTTIASGTTTEEIDLKGGTLVGLRTPASISSTSFTITTAKETGGTFTTLKDSLSGISRTFTIAASGAYDIDPTITAGLRFIKLVFGSSETAKTFTLAYRDIA